MNVCQTLYDVASIIEINLKYKKRENIQPKIILQNMKYFEMITN